MRLKVAMHGGMEKGSVKEGVVVYFTALFLSFVLRNWVEVQKISVETASAQAEIRALVASVYK